MSGNLSKAAATAALVQAGLRPRLLCLELAAAYVGLSADAFLKAVKEKIYPAPIADGRRRQWDIRALDEALDRRSGVAASSRMDESPEAIMRAIDAA